MDLTANQHKLDNICEWKSTFVSQQDPRVKWEFLKYRIFRFSKNFANELAEKRNGSP